MNVPKLRFKEFNDEWITYKFYDLVSIINGQVDPNKKEYCNLPHIGPGNIEKETGRLLEYNLAKDDKLISSKYLFNEKSVIYGKINPHFAKVCYPKFVGLCSADAYPINPIEEKLTSTFLLYLLLNPKFTKFATSVSMRTGMPKINRDELGIYKFTIPKINEQIKIGKTLELLDKKIELQSKKIEDLKLFKKGFIEFEFSNSNYNEINLKEILKERKSYSEKGLEFPHVTLSKDGIYDKTDRYNRDFLVKSDDKKYKITYLNDLCYNPANLKFGVICLNEYGSAIFSPIYVTFIIKNIANPKYIKYYVTRNNFINAIRKYEQGTVYERMAVAPEDFLKFSIKLPNIEIQNKFVDKLSKLDQKIDLENLKLSRYIKLKKGLMQNMFV